MRDIIKKTLQLGLAQHLCLFTLADEFSPLCSMLSVDFYYEIVELSSRLSAKNLWIPSSHNQISFHYELTRLLESFSYCPRPRSVRSRKWEPVPFWMDHSIAR